MRKNLLNFLCLFMLLSAGVANGQTTYTWNGSASTDFTTAENWTPAVTVFDNTGAFVIGAGGTVIYNPPGETTAIPFHGGTLTARAGGLKTEIGSSLTISKFLMTAASQYLNGNITVENGGELNVRAAVVIGRENTGVITVNTGGSLVSNNVIYVGNAATGVNDVGDGTLNINGGTVSTTSVLRIAHSRAALKGVVNFTGGTITSNGLQLGENNSASAGTATFNISGGTATVNGLDVPRAGSNATARVNISGGTLIVTALGINTNGQVVFTPNSTGKIVFNSTTNQTTTLQGHIDAGRIVIPTGMKAKYEVDGTNVTLSIEPDTNPVTLTSFTAKAQANDVKVEWTTAAETNNSHFNVLKSVDGINFIKLATVAAKGPSAYLLSDKQPANGTNYYKLVQYDLDGKSEDHGVRAVNFSLKAITALAVYPNPTASGISFKLDGSSGGVQVVLSDLQGKIVYEGTIKNNTTGEYNLPLKQKLAAGQYILRVNNNGTLQSSKVVVL